MQQNPFLQQQTITAKKHNQAVPIQSMMHCMLVAAVLTTDWPGSCPLAWPGWSGVCLQSWWHTLAAPSPASPSQCFESVGRWVQELIAKYELETRELASWLAGYFLCSSCIYIEIEGESVAIQAYHVKGLDWWPSPYAEASKHRPEDSQIFSVAFELRELFLKKKVLLHYNYYSLGFIKNYYKQVTTPLQLNSSVNP